VIRYPPSGCAAGGLAIERVLEAVLWLAVGSVTANWELSCRSMRRILGGFRSGHAVVEIALMAPWLLFLFLAIFNFGFFMYAGMSVANAARVAALELARASVYQVDQARACDIVKRELDFLPNASSFPNTCNAAPLQVLVGNSGAAVTDSGGNPMVRVRVNYTSIQLFPLPWLRGLLTLGRQAEVRIYQ
jgi:hypothetical protein